MLKRLSSKLASSEQNLNVPVNIDKETLKVY